MDYSKVIKPDINDNKTPLIENKPKYENIYIHKPPKLGSSYNRWFSTYEFYLERLYLELDLNIDKEKFFRLLYDTSSGELTKYI